jgi:hypothetical protein
MHDRLQIGDEGILQAEDTHIAVAVTDPVVVESHDVETQHPETASELHGDTVPPEGRIVRRAPRQDDDADPDGGAHGTREDAEQISVAGGDEDWDLVFR